jgi:topoisomerase-4 subunit B
MRLEPIILKADTSIPKLLAYYMGKNTPERQQFIIENLRYELDVPEGLALEAEESAVPALAEG